MNDAAFAKRRAEILESEASDGKRAWWWLSFADGTLPKGSQFLGLAIVEAAGLMHAIRLAHRLGINPGGEVQGYELPGAPRMDLRNRLIPPPEARELGSVDVDALLEKD